MDIRKTQALRDILTDKSLLKEKCYIDGKWVEGKATIDVTNPVNNDVVASVPNLGQAETRSAIEAAASHSLTLSSPLPVCDKNRTFVA